MECLPSRVLQKIFILLTLESLLKNHLALASTGPSGIFLASTFLLYSGNRLPSSYRSSAYLSTETALQNLQSSTDLLPNSSAAVTEFCNDVEVIDRNLTVTDMPHKTVCDLFINDILLFSLLCIYSYH